MLRTATRAALVALIVATPAVAPAQTVVGPGAPADPQSADFVDLNGAGAPAGAFRAVAQSFVAPLSTPILQSFTFYLDDTFGNGDDLRVRANVFAFDGSRVTGAALFDQEVVGSTGVSQFPAFTFTPVGGITLVGGQTYAFVLSAFGGQDLGANGYAANFIAASETDVFGGGALFASTSTSYAGLSQPGAFATVPRLSDAQFTATFSAVPEPSTYALLATGLGVLGAVARRRRTGRA